MVFTFNGTGYTTFRVSTTGFITLGNATTPSSSVYVPLSNTGAAYNNCISALGADLKSTVRFEVLGTTPNQVAAIQWSDAFRYSASTSENLSFPVRLYETSNKIEIVYGPMTTVTYASALGQVGLKGGASTDINNVSFTNATLTGYTYTRRLG